MRVAALLALLWCGSALAEEKEVLQPYPADAGPKKADNKKPAPAPPQRSPMDPYPPTLGYPPPVYQPQPQPPPYQYEYPPPPPPQYPYPPPQDQYPDQPMDPYSPYAQQPPPQQPYAPPIMSTPLPRAPRPESRGLVRVGAGYTYRYMLGDSWNALGVDVMLGRERPGFGMAGRIGLDVGQSSAGINYELITLGGAFEWHLGKRFRLGYSPLIGIAIFNRATVPDNDIATLVLGTHVDVSVDLVKFKKGGALVLKGTIGYEYIFSTRDQSIFLGHLGIGIRF
jgi:hypothetical protein